MTQATEADLRELLIGMERRLDAKLDAIAADVVALKIAQEKTDERFAAIDQHFDSVEKCLDMFEDRFKSQDKRF